MAFKIGSSGVEPDVEVSLNGETNENYSYYWAFPFVNKNDIHVAYTKIRSGVVKYLVSFIKELDLLAIPGYEYLGLYWYDGLFLIPSLSIKEPCFNLHVYFYDCINEGDAWSSLLECRRILDMWFSLIQNTSFENLGPENQHPTLDP